MKTIAEFDSIINASIIKGELESFGIRCELQGESIAQVLPNINPILLKVHEDDFDKALEILQKHK